MNKTELLATVQEIVQDTLGLKDFNLTLESSAKDVERWDSVANIGIIMGIEQEFDFRFNLGELDSIQSIGDIVDAIIRHT
jgi:acyl carrier protein